MQKSENNLQIIEGLVGIGFLILILAFIIFFKSDKSKEVTSNKNILGQVTETAESQTQYDSQLLKNHLELLGKLGDEAEDQKAKSELTEILIQSLDEKTKIPTFNSRPIYISDTFDKNNYQKEFFKTFNEAAAAGMGLELYYFVSQISPESGEMLELSPYDKESLQRIATEYEIFGKKIQKIETPTDYIKAGETTSQKAFEISYILRNLLEEKDSLVYSKWFEKYGDASRYIFKSSSSTQNSSTTGEVDTQEILKQLKLKTEVLDSRN